MAFLCILFMLADNMLHNLISICLELIPLLPAFYIIFFIPFCCWCVCCCSIVRLLLLIINVHVCLMICCCSLLPYYQIDENDFVIPFRVPTDFFLPPCVNSPFAIDFVYEVLFYTPIHFFSQMLYISCKAWVCCWRMRQIRRRYGGSCEQCILYYNTNFHLIFIHFR